MESSRTVMQVKELSGGDVLVCVSREAAGFRRFLANAGYKVSDFSERDLKGRRWQMDSDGSRYVEEPWAAREFTCDVPFSELPTLFDEWNAKEQS